MNHGSDSAVVPRCNITDDVAMATVREGSVEHSTEHEEFIAKLREYHAKRGTSFDPEPKVGQRRVDLLKLWNEVIANGGYDKVSNNRLMPLAWKNIGGVLGLDKATHPTALAFMLKTVFYRNLAYAILLSRANTHLIVNL